MFKINNCNIQHYIKIIKWRKIYLTNIIKYYNLIIPVTNTEGRTLSKEHITYNRKEHVVITFEYYCI